MKKKWIKQAHIEILSKVHSLPTGWEAGMSFTRPRRCVPRCPHAPVSPRSRAGPFFIGGRQTHLCLLLVLRVATPLPYPHRIWNVNVGEAGMESLV